MSAAHSFQPDELELVIRKLAKGEPLSRAEGQLVHERVDALVEEIVDPEDAPIDDEPETPEEAAAVAEARAEIARGEVLTSEELKRSLGLLQGVDREWRLRVGDYRVRFTLDDAIRVMYVLRVLPRGSAYR